MSNTKALFALMTVVLLWMTVLIDIPMAVADDDGGEILRFAEGTSTLELFTDDLGEEISLTLPMNAKVKEASITLKGILPPVIDEYDVGNGPLSIRGADVDGDGDIDLGVVNSKSDSVSILLNDGAGNFDKTTPLDFTVGLGPYDLVLQDFSNDGVVDLATADYDGESVTVRVTKNEMFGSHETYKVGGSPLFLLCQDMNDDTYPDLIVVRKEFPVIAILFNKGEGTFNPAFDVNVRASPEGAVVTDIDGDGDLDIVVASTDRPYSVIIVENKGNKNFIEGPSHEVQWPPSDIVVGDLSGDGRSDIVVSSAEGNITVFENTEMGLGDPRIIPYRRQKSMFMADLDSDGVKDLISVARVDSTVRTFINKGIDDFVLDQLFIMGNNPNDILMADLNGDGDLDLATADLAGDSVSVVFNNGRGRFTWYDVYDVGDSDKILALGDLDADGDQDLVASNYNQQTITIAYNSGRGVFDDTILKEGFKVYGHAGGSGGSEPFYVSMADWDGDGDIDIEYGEELSYSIVMMFNKGNREFDEDTVALENGSSLLPGPPYITLPMDLDDDGDLDIITNHINHAFISILVNDGTGYFKSRLNHSMGDNHPYDMVIEDFDGDGDLDLVTANFGVALDYENTLTFIRNDGGGKLTNVKNITVKRGPRSLSFGDFNKDGKRDIVVGFAARKGLTDIVPGEVAILLATDGKGNFADPVYYRAGILPGRVRATDLNEDGAADVVCINQGTGSGGSISVLINRGDGTLAPQIEYPYVPFSLGVFHDLIGDGRDELVLPILSTQLAIYRALYYPGNVDVSVGTADNVVWNADGVFKSAQQVNLTDALNSYIKDNEDKELEDIVIPIGISSGQAGIVGLSELKVGYVIKEEKEDGEDGKFDISDPGTLGLIVMLIVLIFITLGITAPRTPEETEKALKKGTRRGKVKGGKKKGKKKGKTKGKRKGKKKKKEKKPIKKEKVEEKLKKKKPKVVVEVIKKKKKMRHKDEIEMEKLDKALHMREELKKKK